MLEQGNEMGDANLVNGAQMGPCVAARWRQPLAWQSFWQESIYVYCPWLEVATAAAAQVLFRATKCHGGDPRPSISGGYLTDPLYRRRLKGLLRIIIQSKISAPNQLSLVTSKTKVGLKWETTEDERHFESHF